MDTDVLVEAERGSLEALPGEEDLAISVITVSELLHGVHRASGDSWVRRRAFVEHVLAGIEAVPITEPVARVHAEIWADASGRGESVGAHDLWIAATALAYGFGLATRNVRDFVRIPGLRLVGA